MRLIIIAIGLFFIKINDVKLYIYRIYLSKLYKNQLSLKGKFSFREGFNLNITKNSKVTFSTSITYMNHCNITAQDGGELHIGSGTFFNNGCSIAAMDKIVIGENCLFGENVKIYDHNHRYNDQNKLIKDQGYNTAPIEIGNNVWVGSNVVILKGVRIGDNSIVGASCVVRASLPNNSRFFN